MSSLSEPFIGISPPSSSHMCRNEEMKEFRFIFFSCQLKFKIKAFAALFSEQTTKTSFGWRLFFTMSAVLFYSIFILAIFAFSLLGNHFHHAKETREKAPCSDFFLRTSPFTLPCKLPLNTRENGFLGRGPNDEKSGSLTHRASQKTILRKEKYTYSAKCLFVLLFLFPTAPRFNSIFFLNCR